ncbi:hypothetical protein ACQ4LE_008117 [Meloidogyne hapla]
MNSPHKRGKFEKGQSSKRNKAGNEISRNLPIPSPSKQEYSFFELSILSRLFSQLKKERFQENPEKEFADIIFDFGNANFINGVEGVFKSGPFNDTFFKLKNVINYYKEKALEIQLKELKNIFILWKLNIFTHILITSFLNNHDNDNFAKAMSFFNDLKIYYFTQYPFEQISIEDFQIASETLLKNAETLGNIALVSYNFNVHMVEGTYPADYSEKLDLENLHYMWLASQKDAVPGQHQGGQSSRGNVGDQ